MPGIIPALSLQAIRPMDCQILMGKNTLMKRCIRLYCENKQDDAWGALVPELVGNVGILFVRNDFAEIKEVVEQFRQPAAARANAIAQCDVGIDAGPTSLDPSQTSFFQALGISTKIQKGVLPEPNMHSDKVAPTLPPQQHVSGMLVLFWCLIIMQWIQLMSSVLPRAWATPSELSHQQCYPMVNVCKHCHLTSSVLQQLEYHLIHLYAVALANL